MSENLQVKKRFYTRLMDLYRHNDIYIPGFNTLTRSVLKTKAESHFREISVKAKKREADVSMWYAEKQLFFGFGVFRSGTTFLADFLNRHVKSAVVQHEANVNDYWFYAKAIHSNGEARTYISDYRLNEIFFRLEGVQLDVYGEINPFLRRHCKAIGEDLPEAKRFQIVRDPRKVIRSLMSRELFDRKDPMGTVIYPNTDDPYSEQWDSMSRFEKLCWLWSADNKFIRENTSHTILFEKLRTDFDYFQSNVLDYLELDMNPDDWHNEIGKVYNSTPRYTFPEFKDWAVQQRQQFERICGEEMAYYGY